VLVGSIEAGGTKFVCAVGDEDYRIKDSFISQHYTGRNITKNNRLF
jgi:hypothetical protein